MTWTYDPTQLAENSLYQVRRLVGDVISSDQQVADEEVTFALSNRGTVFGAAADVVRMIAAQYSRKVDVITSGAGGNLKTNYSAQAKAFFALAADLEVKASIYGATPYAGGISVRDKQIDENDTDRVPPQFDYGMTDNLINPVGPVGNETSDSTTPINDS